MEWIPTENFNFQGFFYQYCLIYILKTKSNLKNNKHWIRIEVAV